MIQNHLRNKTFLISIGVLAGLILHLSVIHAFFGNDSEDSVSDERKKHIILFDDGMHFDMFTNAITVGELLQEKGIKLDAADVMLPNSDEKIYDGTKIIVQRVKKIKVIDGVKVYSFETNKRVIEDAIWQQKDINLGPDDITSPARNTLVKDGMEIKLTHVLIKEDEVSEAIPFTTVTNEDDSLSWRTKKVTQKGENGILKVKYRIVYHNGKEISRKILNKNREKEPVSEIVTQGTYVKTGKAHTGVASWYAFRGGLFAANPWLPMGSYVKVTNLDNGKSVIVKINDRGPFGNGRIIDLDKVAFAKIASLGAGVANVKMEEIAN